MAIQQKISIKEFEVFLDKHPAGTGLRYELINGEIFTVTSNLYSSMIASKIIAALINYLENNPIGGVSGEQGGYLLDEDTAFAPDVAFIKNEKLADLSDEGFHPQPPDFVVEVVSPSDLKNPRRIREKLAIYQKIKISLLWIVYPRRNAIEVYEDGILIYTAGIHDVLDGGKILPGFTLATTKFLNVKPGA